MDGRQADADRAPVPYRRPVRSLLARLRGIDKRVFDSVLAGVLAVVGVIGTRVSAANSPTHPNAFAYLLVLVCTLALLWRRRYPVIVMVVTLGTAVAITAIGYPDGGTVIAALVAFYSAAAYGGRRRTSIAALTFAGSMAVLWLTRHTSRTTGQDLLSNVFVFGAAWAVGEIIRTRRERIATLEARAAVLERERIDEAQRAVADERLRIARELHDVVAHAMSVITVQAGVGAHVIDTQPEEAKRALEAIETTGRSTLQELRRMLGVLRSEEAPRGLRRRCRSSTPSRRWPRPSRATGTSVEIHWVGDVSTPVPLSVRLTGYRIVQEALTNVMKHAGRASAVVTITVAPDCIRVEVVDDGRGSGSDPAGIGGGHGLIGMRERVAVFSGTLQAGPMAGGGFRVAATVPFEPSMGARS